MAPTLKATGDFGDPKKRYLRPLIRRQIFQLLMDSIEVFATSVGQEWYVELYTLSEEKKAVTALVKDEI